MPEYDEESNFEDRYDEMCKNITWILSGWVRRNNPSSSRTVGCGQK
jgi:hypothetical protein